MEALDELEQFISSEQYDYNTYFTSDSKVLVNSSKLLILSVFLFKILTKYKMPDLKVMNGAQTQFQNE
jgi:predicted RNase H-related nuclease YkuK (DUF458 family)